ncbi:enoyl-CoA hydratase/isomerase family protein [Pseudonocardia endophytica]|uniref:Enoyl-CoA hydratase/carnithine racemase n=1 Tax=Pseudonocardia endophytica TaxID=401976 RepID=A0A4R1I112_PSEEN|nr:enoyl-CoA hydratase/isomerase family protein [Pseudonocardia endophytica]TCK27583.1 enoyl-CoA hydratase/carnithine racemase [Pseudonocardia endophytica]
MSQWTYLKTSVDGGVGLLRLNRPDKRNALSTVVCDEIGACLDEWRRDDSVAVVVITGGEDFFSAGMDLQEYLDHDAGDYYRRMGMYHRAYRTLADYPKPTIAAVAGPAFAGGCDLLTHCDLRVVARNVMIGMPQPKYGIHSHFSPLWRLVGLSRAKLMFFTGDHIDADEAHRIGLADVLVETGSVVAEATGLARRMAALGVETQMRLKEVTLRSPNMDPLTAVDYETAAYRDVCADVNSRARVDAGLAQLREHRSHALSGKL